MITKLTRKQHQDDRKAVAAMIAKLQATTDHDRAASEAREARSGRVDDTDITWIG